MTTTPSIKSRALILVIIAIIIGTAYIVFNQSTLATFLPVLWSKLSTFATVFLGIFIEAIPFLLLGTLGSGFVEAFLDHDQIQRNIPRGAFLSAVTGSLMGMIFPVCECGVVPLTRRLFSKGLPVAAGIAFLLAAPVLNPIVIFSTSTAFGWGWMLAGRVGFSMLIAVTTGLVFSVTAGPQEIMLSSKWMPYSEVVIPDGNKQVTEKLNIKVPVHGKTKKKTKRTPANFSFFQNGFREKLVQMALIAGDEFFEMGRFLVLGAAIAAAMQIIIPQQALLQIGHGPVTSVLVMLALAVILSICSTVDAFIVLGFVSIFSPGAILAFLIFGPMVDIKTTLMYLSVFKKRTVIYLILFPFLMSLLAGITINLLFP